MKYFFLFCKCPSTVLSALRRLISLVFDNFVVLKTPTKIKTKIKTKENIITLLDMEQKHTVR